MTEIAVRPASDVVGAFDPRDGQILQYLGFNPADPKSRAVVAVAKRYDLDPLLKHVIVIPKGGVYITRDGYLHVAHTSGQLDGIVVEQEPTLSEDGKEWTARVSVWRKDMSHPFTFPGRYPVNGGNRDYAQEMALKAAEAHALRRAFNVTGLPSADEQRPEGDAAAPRQRVTGDSIRARTAPAEVPIPVTSDQITKLHTVFTAIGWNDRDDKLRACSVIVGRPIGSSKELTKDEAVDLIDTLREVAAQADPAVALAELLADIGEQPVDADVVEDGEG